MHGCLPILNQNEYFWLCSCTCFDPFLCFSNIIIDPPAWSRVLERFGARYAHACLKLKQFQESIAKIWAIFDHDFRHLVTLLPDRDKSHPRYGQWLGVIGPAQLGFTAILWLLKLGVPCSIHRWMGLFLSCCFIVGLHGAMSLWGLAISFTYSLYWGMGASWTEAARVRVIWMWHGMLLAINEAVFQEFRWGMFTHRAY